MTKTIHWYEHQAKNRKSSFKEAFFSLMNNSVYEKTIGNERKYREIKLITAEGKRNYLMSELNYHPTKFFTKCLLAIGMRKAQTLMNKHI